MARGWNACALAVLLTGCAASQIAPLVPRLIVRGSIGARADGGTSWMVQGGLAWGLGRQPRVLRRTRPPRPPRMPRPGAPCRSAALCTWEIEARTRESAAILDELSDEELP